jgi:hypothetical protein
MIYLYQEHGVNCCISSPRTKIFEAIKQTEKEIGDSFHWICSPSNRLTVKGLESDLFKQIDWCAEHNVSVCIPHRDYTDNAIDKENLKIGGKKGYPDLNEVTEYIRKKGMIPGLSTHYIESIEAAEKRNYDVKVIVQPLNKIGFESNTTPDILVKRIQSTKFQIINIKPMAAGRIPPREALPWNLDQIKEKDFLAIGFGHFHYCKEDMEIVQSYFARKEHK